MIWGNIRIGDKVYSPNIPAGEGHILLSMEPLEALRWSSVLREDGVIIMNTKRFYPTLVQQEKATYPEEEISKLKERYRTIEIDAIEEGIKIGKKQVSNVLLLGILSKFLDIKKEIWEDVIVDNVPKKSIDMNLMAFQFGYDLKID